MARSGNAWHFARPDIGLRLDPVMRTVAVALALTLSGCFTTIGAGAGAGIGYAVGNPVKGAMIGGLLGLRADIELVNSIRGLGRMIFFWTRPPRSINLAPSFKPR